MKKIIMHGCNGKMGQAISKFVEEDDQVRMVAGIDVMDQGKNPYPVFSSIKECTVEGDVIIDFSTAKAIDGLLEYCVEKQIPCVLCTTGLSEEQLLKVEEASKKVAILKSANMSLGVNLLAKVLKEVAEVLVPAGFDVEVVEKHHNQKVDAPSGTALALADSVNEVFDNSFEYIYDRSTKREKRSKKEIGISSLRGGTIVGEHDVVFAGADEVITLSHTAYSKEVFAKGAVQAAKFLDGKTPKMYDMSDVINK